MCFLGFTQCVNVLSHLKLTSRMYGKKKSFQNLGQFHFICFPQKLIPFRKTKEINRMYCILQRQTSIRQTNKIGFTKAFDSTSRKQIFYCRIIVYIYCYISEVFIHYNLAQIRFRYINNNKKITHFTHTRNIHFRKCTNLLR